MNKRCAIIVVGAGAFGVSTAYHLAKRGYTSVKVFDRHPIPSCEAAATDISKVIRSDYNEEVYMRMGIEAIQEWNNELFRDFYHVPGWILGPYNLSIPFVEGSIEVSRRVGVHGIRKLSKDEVRKQIPQVTGKLDGWNINVWNPTAGWVNAAEALRRMALAAEQIGVQFYAGTVGSVKQLVLEVGDCKCVITEDGFVHRADKVILAAGAWSASLLDLQGQLTSKGHAVAHIQLTPEETTRYATMPILDNLELGYFFPPQEDGIFKTAHSQFLTNVQRSPRTQKTIYREIEAAMRQNLRRVFPELADRPFAYTRLCWDADTDDRHFLVTQHPTYKSLHLATGGSAHGFKFLPILGKYVVDSIEGRLAADIAHKWRWRAGERLNGRSLAHLDPDLDLRSLSGWQGRRQIESRVAKL